MNFLGAARDKISEEERLFVASQWQLIWWKFRKHKLAMISGPVLILLYLIVLTCEFLAPYTPTTRFGKYIDARPQKIHLFDEEFGFMPHVYGLKMERDPETFRRYFVEDPSKVYPINFFVQGESYKFWGLWETRLHLFGTQKEPIFLMGADRLGRDLFSRTIYSSRISLTIGLVGVVLTFVLGLLLGGLSGYLGGLVDMIIQRVIDLLRSIPTIPLWMALAAAVPRDWPVVRTYFAIVIVLSFVGWTSLARAVRGKLLALREEDFVLAARLAGSSHMRIIMRHLLPSFASYIIVQITIAIPNMILGETALSFLGLGIQPPAVSWGVLLQDAQKLADIAHHSWRLIPSIFVIVTVLMFNFLGDGLRDAADPYAR